MGTMEELEEIEEEEETTKEKRKVFRFRYGVRPKTLCPFEALKDYQEVDFDHKALRTHQPEDLPKKKVFIEENTLLLIKPSAIRHKTPIRLRVLEEGFSILREKTIWPSSELMSEFYKEHYGKPWFPKFVLRMVSAPVHIMVLGKYNAVEELKNLVGDKKVSVARLERPYSLRAVYGLRGDSYTNGFHASDSVRSAGREIRFFFPQTLPEPCPTVEEYIDYLQANLWELFFGDFVQNFITFHHRTNLTPYNCHGLPTYYLPSLGLFNLTFEEMMAAGLEEDFDMAARVTDEEVEEVVLAAVRQELNDQESWLVADGARRGDRFLVDWRHLGLNFMNGQFYFLAPPPGYSNMGEFLSSVGFTIEDYNIVVEVELEPPVLVAAQPPQSRGEVPLYYGG